VAWRVPCFRRRTSRSFCFYRGLALRFGRPGPRVAVMPEIGKSTAASAEARPSLVRFIFRLPSFLPLPDRSQVDRQYPHPGGLPEERTPFAIVRLHQVELESDELRVDYLAADAAVVRVIGGAALRPEPASFPVTTAWLTVADVITTWQSPDSPEEDWDGRPQHLGPRQDAVMRAVDAVRTLARAVRLCGQTRIIQDHGKRRRYLSRVREAFSAGPRAGPCRVR